MLILGGGVAWAILLVGLSWPFAVDDAFILFRYGRHLAEGRGLVWNPGGPPVEGYTNLTYVALSAAVSGLGLEPIWVMKALGLASLAAVVGLTSALVRSTGGGRTEALVAAVLLLASPGLCFWAVSGLETTFFTALLLAAMVAFTRDTRRHDALAAGVLLFAALTRTEAPAWAVALMVARGVLAARGGGLRAAWPRLSPWLAFFAVPYGVFFAARASYFGEWLPNPVLFKSTLTVEGGGESVLWPFWRTWWPWCVLAALGLWRTRRWMPAVVALVAVPVFATAMTDAHGSSTVTFFDRYLLPVVPAVALLAAEPLAALLQWRRAAGAAAWALLWGWTSFNPHVNVREVGSLALSQASNVAPANLALAEHLAGERPPGYRVALGDVGFVGWRFHGVIDDVYGLNEYGYTRGCRGNLDCWVKALLARRPDGVVLIMRDDDAPLHSAHRVEQAIAATPEFQARYVRSREFGAGDNPWRYVLFDRRQDSH